MSKPNRREASAPRFERARAAALMIFDSVVMLGELMWLPNNVANGEVLDIEKGGRDVWKTEE